ncbi:peptidase A4 family-domain-containing protein [Mycena crocata]|nr:peptidase A4 family-domain-containing protein [Mycena crocata]
MLFSAFIVQTLIAVGALAAPSIRTQSRVSGRERFVRQVTAPGAFPLHKSNWAGAVLTDPTARWNSVAGQFVIPTFSNLLGLRSAYISVWVGVDGYTCGTATIKVGVDIEIKNGVASYFGWDEYFPGQYNVERAPLFFAAGHTVNLIASSNSSGLQEADIQNLSAGISTGRAFSPGPKLCRTDAVWAVETWQAGDARVPFNINFMNAEATHFDDTVVGPGNATVLNTAENGVVLSACAATASTVSCSFSQT